MNENDPREECAVVFLPPKSAGNQSMELMLIAVHRPHDLTVQRPLFSRIINLSCESLRADRHNAAFLLVRLVRLVA